MPSHDIALMRMKNQQLAGTNFNTPADLVRWLGAVQSQDYLGAKWAIGVRTGINDAAIDQAINDGSIIRLHVLRPTWHFVAPEDARWMLALTGPRVNAGMTSRRRELELDKDKVARSQEIFRQTLAGGKHLTREELEAALNQAGISTSIPQSMAHLLMIAELDCVLCNGVRRGKQVTYALLDERVPPGPPFERETALAELVRRYFASHGPATIKDFVWWSGLTVADTRTGIELAQSDLIREEIEDQTYWMAQPAGDRSDPQTNHNPAHLLPNYDEYVVAYTDRSAIFDPACSDRLHLRGGVLNNVLVMNGLVVGSWRREFKKSSVLVTVEPLWPLSPEELQAVEQAANRYGDFLGMPISLQVTVGEQ